MNNLPENPPAGNPWDRLPPIAADEAGETALAKALFDSLNFDKPGEALLSGRHDGKEGWTLKNAVYDEVQVPAMVTIRQPTGRMVPYIVRQEWDSKKSEAKCWYATTGVNAYGEEFEREVTWDEARQEGITHRLKTCEETEKVEVQDLEDDSTLKFRTERRPRTHPDGKAVTVEEFEYTNTACREDMAHASAWGQRCNPPWTEEQLRQTFRCVATMQDQAAAEKARAEYRKCEVAYLDAEAKRYGLIPAEPTGEVEWLLEGVLRRDMPALWAGPTKTMKTNLGIAAAVALASGKPFLGRFSVPRPVPVYYLTGETVLAEAHAIARHAAAALGISFEQLPIKWGDTLPALTNTHWLGFLEKYLTRISPGGVVFLDPLNQCLPDVDTASMFRTTPVLQAANQAIAASGNTWVALHHCKELRPSNKPPQLSDVAYTVFAQFYRQFLLVGRRRAFASDGNHELAFRLIGPASGGEWALNLDEGNFGRPRCWNARVRPLKEAGAPAGQRKHTRKVLDALQQLVRQGKDGKHATITSIYEIARINKNTIQKELDALIEDGIVESYPATIPTSNKGKTSETTCYRLRPHPNNSACSDAVRMPLHPNSSTPEHPL